MRDNSPTRRHTNSASRKRRKAAGRRRRFRPLLESLEPRVLLAGDTVAITSSGQTFSGTSGDDVYRFVSDWNNTRIAESAGQGIDTLDFSQITADLTFHIRANDEMEVTGSGYTATAQHVERFLAGLGRNVFLVDKGASLSDGAIVGNPADGSQTIVSFSSDRVLPVSA
jgi:hypothetical protein